MLEVFDLVVVEVRVELEKDDIAQLKAVIAAAEAAGAGEHAAVVELRAILARKEKAIE